jgi:hypothetical protein
MTLSKNRYKIGVWAIVSVPIPLLLAGCVLAPPAFDETAWRGRVLAQETAALYAPHQRDGIYFNPWMEREHGGFGRFLRWRFSRGTDYTDGSRKATLPTVLSGSGKKYCRPWRRRFPRLDRPRHLFAAHRRSVLAHRPHAVATRPAAQTGDTTGHRHGGTGPPGSPGQRGRLPQPLRPPGRGHHRSAAGHLPHLRPPGAARSWWLPGTGVTGDRDGLVAGAGAARRRFVSPVCRPSTGPGASVRAPTPPSGPAT